MKRRIFLVIAILLILTGITILAKVVVGFIAPAGQGGLQITSNINADVFLNNKPVGKTPFCYCDQKQTLKAGNYNIKIVPNDATLLPYSARITVNPSVLTAVDRVFLPGALSSAYILTLEKINGDEPEVFISTVPDGALVTIDGQSEGVTPMSIKSISASEHELEIEKRGFAKKTVRIRAVAGFRLVVNSILGTQSDSDDITKVTPTKAETTPTPTVALSPTPIAGKVVILSTPNGFLRIRSEPSVTSAEIGRVNTGESLTYVDENTAWFKVQLGDGTLGWISKTYSQKSN